MGRHLCLHLCQSSSNSAWLTFWTGPFFIVEGHPEPCRMFNCLWTLPIRGWYCTHPIPMCVNQQCLQALSPRIQTTPGGKLLIYFVISSFHCFFFFFAFFFWIFLSTYCFKCQKSLRISLKNVLCLMSRSVTRNKDKFMGRGCLLQLRICPGRASLSNLAYKKNSLYSSTR